MDMDENRILQSIKNEDVHYLTFKVTHEKVVRPGEG
jgi:hypothetical protein